MIERSKSQQDWFRRFLQFWIYLLSSMCQGMLELFASLKKSLIDGQDIEQFLYALLDANQQDIHQKRAQERKKKQQKQRRLMLLKLLQLRKMLGKGKAKTKAKKVPKAKKGAKNIKKIKKVAKLFKAFKSKKSKFNVKSKKSSTQAKAFKEESKRKKAMTKHHIKQFNKAAAKKETAQKMAVKH